MSPAQAINQAHVYALHFLHSKLFTHGEAAEAAADLLEPPVQGVLRALQNALQNLERGATWPNYGGKFIGEIGPHLFNLRQHLPLALLKAPPIEEYTAAAGTFEELSGRLAALHEKAKQLAEEAEKAADEVKARLQTANEAAGSIEKSREEADSSLESIKTILDEAESLREDIEQFKEEFSALSNKHEKLLEDLKERERELSQLLSNAQAQSDHIDEILNAAREALGWAQASGLAGASHESWEHYTGALTRKGKGLAGVILLLALATTGYLSIAPGFIANFLAGLEQSGIEPNAYVSWFVKVLGFVPILALGYGVWAMGVDYAVLRNLAHTYRHREVLARTLQAFRELGPEEERETITREAFHLFLQDPMVRAYRGYTPLQKITGELKTVVGKLRGSVDAGGEDEN